MNWDNFAIAVKAISVCALALFAIGVGLLGAASAVQCAADFTLATLAVAGLVGVVFAGCFLYFNWRNSRANPD